MDLTKVKGYKTYIMSIATICYALGGLVAGFVKPEVAIPLILGALGISALRHGLPQPEVKPVVPASGTMPQ